MRKQLYHIVAWTLWESVDYALRQLGELLREELTALKDAQSASAASLQEKVGEWTSSLSDLAWH